MVTNGQVMIYCENVPGVTTHSLTPGVTVAPVECQLMSGQGFLSEEFHTFFLYPDLFCQQVIGQSVFLMFV